MSTEVETEASPPRSEEHSTGIFAIFDVIGGPLNIFLVAIPIAAILWGIDASQVAQFIFSALAVVPLAGIMGDATETIAEFSGPGVGGLLNATFGNAAELILGLFSVFNHLDQLVKASITGSIIGNVLLVMGMSMFAGGLKHKTQTFNKTAIGTSATVCVAASIAIVIPAVTVTSASTTEEQNLSAAVSVILILSYCVMLWFSLVTHKDLFDSDSSGDEKAKEEPVERGSAAGEPAVELTESGTIPAGRQKSTASMTKAKTALPLLNPKASLPGKDPEHAPSKRHLYMAILKLGIASAFVAWMSEILVGAVEQAGKSIGVSEIFMGVIIVAIVGNAAEHATAVLSAMHNHMDVSINVALGSSMQIAMFVAPVLVLCSYARSEPMDLVFTSLEVFAVFLALVIAWMVVNDGESTWMEGFLLMMLYLILAFAFLFLATDDTTDGT